MSSTLSLPSYVADSLPTPSYSAQPLLHETTLSQGRPAGAFAHAFAAAVPPPSPSSASAEFVKDSKRGGLRLRLSRQTSDNVVVPVFCARGPVEGTLELLKPQDLAFAAIRVRIFYSYSHPLLHPDLDKFRFFVSLIFYCPLFFQFKKKSKSESNSNRLREYSR
jgi:hypothetical protein